VDLSFFQNAANNIGVVRTAKETKFLDPSIAPQPASKFNRPFMLEFAASKGFVPGDVYAIGKDAWKVIHIPAERMELPALITLARETLGIFFEQMNDSDLIDSLLVGHNSTNGDWVWGPDKTATVCPFLAGEAPALIKRRTSNDQVKARWFAEALFTAMGATLLWCSPKSGATGIWLYQGDGATRAWNDVDPFFIAEVTQKLPKRLAAFNRDTILSHFSQTICLIEVELVKRASDNEAYGFRTTEASDKIRYNEGDLVIVWWKAEEGDDGWGIISKRLTHSMIHELELPLRAENPDLVDHMLGHGLWQIRGFMPEGLGVNPMMKCDMARTKEDTIVVHRRNGTMFNADLALNTDGLKPEVGIDEGCFFILDHVTDRPGVQARTNRHMMTVGYDAFLKNRIFHGLAMRNDDLINEPATGNFPKWMSILAESGDPVLADNHTKTTVNTYHKRITDVVTLIGDITYTRKGMEDVRTQHLDRSAPEYNSWGKALRDTYHYPVPASDNSRSLKPLRMALLTGWLDYDFVLADGEWVNCKVGFIVNTKTWVYMMVCLAGDGDDHGTGLHGISSCDDAFYATQAAKDAGVPDMVVKANDLITVLFRWPTGVSCNGQGEWGVEYFVLKPHISERIQLTMKYDFDDEIYRFDMEDRPKRIDEVVYPAKDSPVTFQPQGQKFRRNGVVAVSYGIDTFVWQLQSALEVADFGGIGAISNVDMFGYQHKLNYKWFCHNEIKVDLCTQSIPSASDIIQIRNYIDSGISAISNMNGWDVDAVALERFRFQLGKDHPLFASANPGLLFGFLEAIFENFMKEFKKRYQALLNQQTENMLRLLSDIELDGTKKPRLIRAYDSAKERVLAKVRSLRGTSKLNTDEFDLASNMVIIAMDKAQIAQSDREDDMMAALAFLYRNGAVYKYDQNLLNGELLVLLGETLAKLRAGNHDAHLCEELQTTIRCRAVDHDHLTEHAAGCWIQRNEGPDGVKAWREQGDQMSVRCAVKVFNLRREAGK